MGSRLLSGGECLLVEAPAVNSHRAAVVMWQSSVETACSNVAKIALCIPLTSRTAFPQYAVNLLMVVCLSLPKPRPPRVKPTYFPDAANLRGGDVVDAFLLLQPHVAIHLQAGEMVEGPGVSVGEHGGVAEVPVGGMIPQ